MKTAVDWLEEELKGIYESDYFNKLLNQAKAMEKQQIIDAMDRMGNTDFYCEFDSPEQYYNETFKSE